jgi:hypothetical protein
MNKMWSMIITLLTHRLLLSLTDFMQKIKEKDSLNNRATDLLNQWQKEE